jgi:hypothetical protein
MQYLEWMEEGKYEIVKRALRCAMAEGVKAPHHLYFTFRVSFPGVKIHDELRAQYPQEMTIALNDVFWNLSVQDAFFSVELLFETQRHLLKIPYKALVNFIDPGVEFALQFNWEDSSAPMVKDNIIFLDKFRPQSV